MVEQAIKTMRSHNILHRLTIGLSALIAIGLSYNLLVNYVAPGLNMYLVLMALPFAFLVTDPNQKPIRFGLIALPGLAAYYWMEVQTLYFVGFGCFILFLVEQVAGKISKIPFILLILLSPFLSYFINVFSFPIRLHLTEWIGQVLQFTRFNASKEGNIIHLNDYRFAVEHACVGLKMVITTFILGFAMLAYFQQRQKWLIPYWAMGLFTLAVIAFIIVANFIRIWVLVLTRAEPNTLMHDIIGLFSLLVYGLIPLFLVASFISRYNKPSAGTSKSPNLAVRYGLMVIGLLFMLFYYGEGHSLNKQHKAFQFTSVKESGYKEEKLRDDILKLTKGKTLVYLKGCRSFYSSTHSPAICWKGSGYQLTQGKPVQVKGNQVLMAKLTKGDHVLHTAWWYSNGQYRTTGQLDWRLKSAKGSGPFFLVNVSAPNLKLLKKRVKGWMNNGGEES